MHPRRSLFPCVATAVACILLAPVEPAVGQSRLVSPTGIPYTVPAAARGAGWTIAATQARTAFFASNPAFLAGDTRWEVALDTAWQQRDSDLPGLSVEDLGARLAGTTFKASVGRLAFGVSWQRPFHADVSYGGSRAETELTTLVGGAALEVRPGLLLGASLAYLHVDPSGIDDHSYQASAGAEFGAGATRLAAAIKTPLFGADADRLDGPAWLQLDARFGRGPAAAWGARLGVGWWNGDASDWLEIPVDAGVGAAWQVVPLVRILGGVHQIRQRIGDLVRPDPQFFSASDFDFEDLDQGTFLDLGVLVEHPPLHAALAVEDNRVFGDDPSTTWVTLSVAAGF